MKDTAAKRAWEKKVISNMIAIYCDGQHGRLKNEKCQLCPDCAELAAYAHTRSDNCPMIETKAFCANCTVHCYKPSMRQKIREVMRYAGPRMMLHHPARSDNCPMIETKAFCANCTVHCYKPSMRQKIREVMRYAGPRMMLHHPVDALRHLVWNTREKRQIAKKAKKGQGA